MSRRFTRDETGATIVEFALAMPTLLLILLVCVDFGRAANAYVTVANASREGVRYAVQHPGADPAMVKAYLGTRVAPLDPSALVVTLTPTPTTDARWTAAQPAPLQVTVAVSYQWSATTWFTSAFFAAASGSQTFTASSVMETVR